MRRSIGYGEKGVSYVLRGAAQRRKSSQASQNLVGVFATRMPTLANDALAVAFPPSHHRVDGESELAQSLLSCALYALPCHVYK
jgi:hypothetical protein